METRRLFAGVAVRATESLRALRGGWRKGLENERIRWTPPENWHVTIEFFGAVEAARIPELESALAAAAVRTEAFAMTLAGWGVFGGMRHPRVLWMGVEGEGLMALQAAVAASLREAGWLPERRPFAPHVTLARIGRLRNATGFRRTMARSRFGGAETQDVRKLILFESAAGRYLPMAAWKLGPAGGGADNPEHVKQRQELGTANYECSE